MKMWIGTALVASLAIAYPAIAAPVLYGIDDGNNSLITIDRTTGAVSVVGSTGVSEGDFGDLTYDSNNDIMYWVPGRGNDNLYVIDLNTGAATLVGPHGIGDLFGLSYDTQNNILYGSSTDGNLYSINTSTGAATLIGFNGVYPGGLAYDATSDTLYLNQAGNGDLYTINTATGAAILVSGGAGFINDNGLTWDPTLGVFWADDWNENIYQYSADFTSRAVINTYTSALDGIALVNDVQVSPVPEPSTLMLVSAGLGSLAVLRRRKKLNRKKN